MLALLACWWADRSRLAKRLAASEAELAKEQTILVGTGPGDLRIQWGSELPRRFSAKSQK